MAKKSLKSAKSYLNLNKPIVSQYGLAKQPTSLDIMNVYQTPQIEDGITELYDLGQRSLSSTGGRYIRSSQRQQISTVNLSASFTKNISYKYRVKKRNLFSWMSIADNKDIKNVKDSKLINDKIKNDYLGTRKISIESSNF